MNLFKITIVNPEQATACYYTTSVREINKFISAQFTDQPNMPQNTESVLVESVGMLLDQNGNYVPNPEFDANIQAASIGVVGPKYPPLKD